MLFSKSFYSHTRFTFIDSLKRPMDDFSSVGVM